jgi:hypothetical protein
MPNGIGFWRKGDPVEWYKSSNLMVFYKVKPVQDFETNLGDELVLVHPKYCSKCWSPTNTYPPSKVCHNCGEVNEIRESLETMKKAIEDWTGKKDPHI